MSPPSTYILTPHQVAGWGLPLCAGTSSVRYDCLHKYEEHFLVEFHADIPTPCESRQVIAQSLVSVVYSAICQLEHGEVSER